MNGLLHEIYRPLTARPFRHNAGYVELPPCEALRPYVRCFWGSREPVLTDGGPVTPDTCMDVLIRLDPLSGASQALFCGINSRTVAGHADARPLSLFGVRFYFWAAPLFSRESMRGVCDLTAAAGPFFGGLERELTEAVRRFPAMEERVRAAEAALLRRLRPGRVPSAVMNALYAVLRAEGALAIPEAASYAAVSPRQLERLFAEYVGVAPKLLAGLVRYQCLLREVLLAPCFDVQDAVLRFGYTDQSHLLRDFRRFHGMTPKRARGFAMSDIYNTEPARSLIL